jgi:hypothetical protein
LQAISFPLSNTISNLKKELVAPVPSTLKSFYAIWKNKDDPAVNNPIDERLPQTGSLRFSGRPAILSGAGAENDPAPNRVTVLWKPNRRPGSKFFPLKMLARRHRYSSPRIIGAPRSGLRSPGRIGHFKAIRAQSFPGAAMKSQSGRTHYEGRHRHALGGLLTAV